MAEHENFSANKYENASYCWHFHILQKNFLYSAELSMKTAGPDHIIILIFFISP